MTELPPGSHLRGYVLGRIRGRTPHAVLYDAAGPGGRRLSVEAMTVSGADDPIAETRFTAAIRRAARLPADAVLRPIELGIEAERAFVVREPLDGHFLNELLATARPDAETGLAIVRRLLRSVAAIHAAGVVLRQLEPDAILVEPHQARVLDLRYAKELDGGGRASSNGIVIGKAPYIPPEQARGEPVDVRADIHACGALLRLLAPGSAEVIARATAAEPARRFATADEMAAALG